MFCWVVTTPTQTRFVCVDLLEAVVMRRVDSLVYLDILDGFSWNDYSFESYVRFYTRFETISFDHSCQVGR